MKAIDLVFKVKQTHAHTHTNIPLASCREMISWVKGGAKADGKALISNRKSDYIHLLN